ncbi:lipase/esterase [Crassisporium funariophilum]|nr:lipase/esterase [Crassisporium funariophilum]
MPVTTTSAAIHIAPVVVKTFFEHGKNKAKRLKTSKDRVEVPQDDIFFDEAFHIVKAFIAMGTKNTIESLQAFTNTHVPAPYWSAVSPVIIPLSSCNEAADALIEWFGPEELKHVVGGERWWQVRGLDGVDGEWIAEQADIEEDTEIKMRDGRKLSDDDANILRMERLETVMLYVHGGGYFWGSINTHRYQILHYARKYKGRAFAVNYRKAPQYPWPCPLHDVIAAYLYLIRPPPGALHKPVPHSKIVFAGDSAGGGLCLTTLTILRDLGLPMPAGAVLISPWVDLTHSFPSVMQNFDSDIIPKHGFLAKPSTLWPLPSQPGKGGRVVPTETNEPPVPGKPDTLKPTLSRLQKEETENEPGEPVKSQQEMLDDHNSPVAESPKESNEREGEPHSRNPSEPTSTGGSSDDTQVEEDAYDIDHWEPKPPKVLMEDPNAVPLELRSQIQMYATTEQLTHPLVSPILQGSLGNLPPLYIIGGDGEVLRDEIIYLAHRAAHPAQHPTREGILRDSRRQKENAKKFTKPTRVHLQVFDGMCHVLTVFLFTRSARYAYRSIAEFIKHVSRYDEEHLERNPFPELHRPPDDIQPDSDPEMQKHKKHRGLQKDKKSESGSNYKKLGQKSGHQHHESSAQGSETSEINLYRRNERMTSSEVKNDQADTLHSISNASFVSFDNGTEDLPGVLMVRERVDIRGKVRPMEPQEDLQALKLKPSEIGIIKEAPCMRWNEGQAIWDKRYAKNAVRAIMQQTKNKAEAERIIKNALDQGLLHSGKGETAEECRLVATASTRTATRKTSLGKIQSDRRWGPLDLADENPPPTAIAARRDTPEALALLRKSIYHTAPVTHHTVPKLKKRDAIRAAFNPNDDPNKPPKQSVSEQQVKNQILHMHGLNMWDSILKYFGRKSQKKAMDGIHSTAKTIGMRSDEGSEKES